MKKRKISELDTETLNKVLKMALEEKKPLDVLKEKYGLPEHEIIDFMKARLSEEKFDIWKKNATASKQKPKPLKFDPLQDDDLDSKYYFKNKFD